MNINSIPTLNSSPKNNMIYQSLVKAEADIVGFSETNRNWNKMESDHRWYERTKGWFESSKSSIAHNVRDIESTTYQPGGNLLLSINKASHRVLATDRDPTGLGRWTSTSYRGRRNIVLRVIVAYRACRSSGPNLAYMQQQRYLDIIGRNICPRQALLDDLGEVVKAGHDQGQQIVLMMDCNTYIFDARFRDWIRDIGLNNGIFDLDHPQVPATYH